MGKICVACKFWTCCRGVVGEKLEEKKGNTGEEPLITKVQRWYGYVGLASAVVAMTAVAVMSLSTSADVIKRWLLTWPFPGVHELNECLLVVMLFLGVTWTQVKRRHIRVSFVVSHMSPKMVVVMDTIACLICLICIAALGWASLQEGLHSVSIREFSGTGIVRVPIWWARMLVPIGSFMFAAQLVVDVWANIARLMGKLRLEIPDIKRARVEAEM